MPPQDVAKLLKLYEVTQPDVVTALESLARDAGKQGWWQTYGDVLALNYKDYLTLETDAESIHINAPLIPGLLQTGAYARDVAAALPVDDSRATIKRIMERNGT